jgi:hypothetical protein
MPLSQRITVTLPDDVAAALRQAAELDYRHPRAQAGLLIEKELRRRGLLPRDAHTPPRSGQAGAK